ncbi:MAG: prolipoprotein diacylglyceryl transferase [Anaerolineales bacterium]|jgi:phosphatidylglycerol:prolipoprotein diacylglycerol transferase
MSVDAYGIHLGILYIRFYGLILMAGAIAAAFLAERQARKLGLDSERVWDMLIWVLIAGVIGARLWHILTPPQSMIENHITAGYYLTHPLDALAIWRGGLGIPGAVAGGVLAIFWYTRRNKLSFVSWLDVTAPALALGQAIGRWGNFINQELYGSPTNLPWAIYIAPENRLTGFQQYAYYHPLFLYESLWNLLNLGVLLYLTERQRGRLRAGDLFLVYLIIYPVGRFFLEFLRLDPSPVAGIDINQALMAVVALASAGLLLWRHWTARSSRGVPVGAASAGPGGVTEA